MADLFWIHFSPEAKTFYKDIAKKLSYKTAVEESDDQASGTLKWLNKSVIKGIGSFLSGKKDIKDDSFLSRGALIEKKIRRKILVQRKGSPTRRRRPNPRFSNCSTDSDLIIPAAPPAPKAPPGLFDNDPFVHNFFGPIFSTAEPKRR
uniref:Uncharacterized protein n=1 Tax=Romanomermis culicivorax TaxID=13658 RepID=A0A915KU73_ROMCU